MGLVPKIQDIADELGISVSTVSRALSGSRLVGEEVRGEVERVAAEQGYVRRPRRRRRGIVNLRVVADGVDSIVGGLAGLLAGLREGMAGVPLNLFCDLAEPDYDPFPHKKGGDVDAFVFAQRDPDQRVLERVSGQGTPLVVIDGVLEGRACVAPDHLDGMDRLVGYLAERMPELHPCFVVVDESGWWEQERLEGLAGACTRRGVEFDPASDVIRGPGFREAAGAVTARCAAGAFNALVCCDDLTAVAVINELGRAGIGVGSRVLVSGFGGQVVARLLRPAPVTIEVSSRALGVRAAAMIDAWLHGGGVVNAVERVGGVLVTGDGGARGGG